MVAQHDNHSRPGAVALTAANSTSNRIFPKAPELERRFVGITTNREAALAAIVSSYMGQSDRYFAVFEFPEVDYPHQSTTAQEHDGYTARVMGIRAATQINNALAHIQPQHILLIGLTSVEKTYLKTLLPTNLLIEIDGAAEVPVKLPVINSAAPLKCKPSQIIEGLLHARASGRPLEIDENAPELQRRLLRGGKVLIMVESTGDAHDVAAVNYGVCVDADVVLAPPVPRDELESLPRQLSEWRKDRSHYEYQELKRKASRALKGIVLGRYQVATFFTEGLPYGLFLKNAIPCTHVLKNVDCGLFVVNNLLYEHSSDLTGSALLFSPEFFQSEEIDHLGSVLGDHNYVTTSLRGKSASVRNLSFYGAYYPYDVLHICSHGGETDGYYVVQRFKDREGKPHTLEYYEVVGFAPAGGEMVQVHRKMIFKALDGIKWRTEPLKHYPRYVFEDMMRVTKEDAGEGRTRVPFNSPIAMSFHIKCNESIHQGDFDSLAGLGRPFVFNNTCSSAYELDALFINAGARAYIGTLWSVGTESATIAANAFYDTAVRTGSILDAMMAINKRLAGGKYEDTYIYWGLHFGSFRIPATKSDERVLQELIKECFLWMRKIATTRDQEVKRNSIPVAKFLLGVISSSFAPERVAQFVGLDTRVIEDEERRLPVEEGNSIRGLAELDLLRD